MGRARRIIKNIERELSEIEKSLGKLPEENTFSRLNHPAGASGPKLIRFYMAILLS
jgi:hypothetical protein